jgi:hypothetical protein
MEGTMCTNNSNSNSSTTSSKDAVKVLEAKMNSWRHQVVNSIYDLLLVWDTDQARRALNVSSLADWSWTSPKLDNAKQSMLDSLLANIATVACRSTDQGFSIRDLEFFLKEIGTELSKATELHKLLEEDVIAGKCKLLPNDLQKRRIEMHFDRCHMQMLIGVLEGEVGKRLALAKKLREETAKKEALRQAEFKAKREREAKELAERKNYFSELKARAAAKKAVPYIPPTKRKDFTVKMTSFEDLAVLARKQGKFSSVREISKAEALELSGLDEKAFAIAYKAVRTTPDSAIVTLPDASVISFVKNGAATRYVIRS